jgi:hypothetical protein
MTIPQTKPQSDPFAELQRDLGRAVDATLAKPSHPPAFRQAPAPATMWGPSTPHADTPQTISPLALLAHAADSAHALQEQIRGLTEAIVGEGHAPRTRSAAKLPTGLLPAIAFLATEIETAQADLGQQIAQLRERLR